MSISLCLIVKNEARYLRACLTSARYDELVIVDTGSTDNTREIAHQYTDKVFEVLFNGDFSAARNAALARATADWILFLDADEEFEKAEAERLAALVKQAPRDVWGYRVMRYNFFATGGFYTGRQLKLFRNHPGVRYRRKINETVAESIGELGGKILDAPVLLNHFGHCRSLVERNAKAQRYIALMKEQLTAQPGDPIITGYIGLILRTLGQFDEALRFGKEAVSLAPTSATVQSFWGHILRASGDLEAAWVAYKRATDLKPQDGAAWNMLGVTDLMLGNFEAAQLAFEKAQQYDPLLVHVAINQGIVAEATGQIATAYAFYNQAARSNPAFLRQDWAGRLEWDPFRPFYYETPLDYPGLGYLLANAVQQLKKELEVV